MKNVKCRIRFYLISLLKVQKWRKIFSHRPRKVIIKTQCKKRKIFFSFYKPFKKTWFIQSMHIIKELQMTATENVDKGKSLII